MATAKTTRLDGYVVNMMGPSAPAPASPTEYPGWDSTVGHLRHHLQGATAETEGYALALATSLLWAWGFATLDQINAVIDGTPFLAPPGSGGGVAEIRKGSHRPDEEKLDDLVGDFRRKIARLMGRH